MDEMNQLIHAMAVERAALFDKLPNTRQKQLPADEELEIMSKIQRNQILDNKLYDVLRSMRKG